MAANDGVEGLVDDLVDDLKPVKTPSVRRTTLSWLLVAAVLGALYIAIVGLRADLIDRFGDWRFAWSFVLLTVGFLASSWLCIAAAFPGLIETRRRQTTLVAVLLLCYTGWLSLNSFVFQPGYSEHPGFDFLKALGCCLRITVGVLVPAALATALAARLTPLNVTLSTGTGVLAATLLVNMVSHVNCPIDAPWHVFIGHGVMTLATAVPIFFGLRFLLARLHDPDAPLPPRRSTTSPTRPGE